MKISWGYKIAGAYITFVIGILFLVFQANRQTFDLVTEDYYGEELKFQNVIDRRQRASELSALPQITYAGGELKLALPSEFVGKEVKGELYLYRPSDARKDIRKSFSVTGTDCNVLLPGGLSGMYDIKLSWQSGGQSFYHEQKIFF
ncbi:FixH family protein [Paraflavisolibacter sp. H34]|uniref:FixH family protein n=1 Tax=Huijunlia imazamoxiresistens TaxID=3127457 RepID=UPI0030160DBE